MRFLIAIIIAAGATGCAIVPYDESSQAPDWVEVVNIRKQELAYARAAVDESCKRSTHLTDLAEKKTVKSLSFAHYDSTTRQAIGSAQQAIALAQQANAVCLAWEEELEEEKARYEQLGRMLELAFPASIDVDVYHYY